MRQALVEEGHLLEPGADRLEVVGRGLEDAAVGPEGDRRAGAVGLLHLLQRGGRLAVVERDPEDVAQLVDLDVEPGRQGVDDRGADAVQATGHLVAAAAELAAGVQLGEDELDGRTCRHWSWMSVGMPRPLSATRTPPSASRVTSMVSA